MFDDAPERPSYYRAYCLHKVKDDTCMYFSPPPHQAAFISKSPICASAPVGFTSSDFCLLCSYHFPSACPAIRLSRYVLSTKWIDYHPSFAVQAFFKLRSDLHHLGQTSSSLLCIVLVVISSIYQKIFKQKLPSNTEHR